ncbi:hypothetical protein HID58_060857 [Brassica napus]|uniref:Uncharacterized protein n=1 Tax=Brassica napus TaxID=3708 RepID=A0ABQ7ZWX3_BRANA|nr:hypothetical protein HID58_060857 [Brassica napus]
MEPRKRIVCGLSARGIIPPLSQEDRDDDVAPLPQEDTVKVVEISDEEEEDMVELSSEEYMSNMRYLIRVEESEDDIEPEFRRMLERMHEEEKKLREEKFKVLKSGIKIEKGQSSKGDGNKRKRRSVGQGQCVVVSCSVNALCHRSCTLVCLYSCIFVLLHYVTSIMCTLV